MVIAKFKAPNWTTPPSSLGAASGAFRACFSASLASPAPSRANAGGDASTANYDAVGSGSTGHAEAVRISFDPRQVSFAQLLQIYFSIAHDPTQLNRQGPDSGTQYRSAVFAQNAEQARITRAYITQLDKARVFGKRTVTTVELDKPFFDAEADHQDYQILHPDELYILINDWPKVGNLKNLFPKQYRAQPVLVGGTR